ncbi:hypothetical protein ROW55_022160 [Providencia rettgeri]|uniref:hypothetical protein n=1 Tax=Providencia rettgeri TaxID=587 RepID=UPI001B359690|nr:hypothetical protein [Providencia rettgeri]MBQ0211491.1 hypothetical protein [Providencia rettgeri]MDH2379553.1 hypothetical protein [Providencia rettgeri]MDR9616847.1 hypothetical protein [Providencia rettgeri]MDW7803911.1 hypothetical protein [Providencia rettgeri]
MVITHPSAEKVIEVTSKNPYTPFLKGCLCFGQEGNEYNLAGKCNYQYNLEVNHIINVDAFFIHHDISESIVLDVIKMVREDLELDLDNDEIAALLDNSESIRNFEFSGYNDDGEADWAIQQYQGILAHKLGYDCAKSTDEQGTVYIAYCVGRPLLEVSCA